MDKISGKDTTVSVIIPTHDRAEFIGRAIDSVIKQSYPVLEIIVVDDASTDNTEEVINAIGDPRIRYIRHQKNYGGGIARNTGIEATTGEYVAFLDSDDIWLPNKIELQLSAIQNHPHAEKVVSYTQFKNIGVSQGDIQPSRGKYETETVADYLFLSGGEMLTSTLMLPRSLALTIGFRPGLKKHQDLDLCLRLEANGAIFTFIESPLMVWQNESGIKRISKLQDYKISLEWIREYQGLISDKAIQGFIIKEVVPQIIKSDGEKIYAAKLIIEAALYGVISARKIVKLTAWLLLPAEIRKKLKNLAKAGLQ